MLYSDSQFSQVIHQNSVHTATLQAAIPEIVYHKTTGAKNPYLHPSAALEHGYNLHFRKNAYS
jgi:hypothetical protein